MRRFSVRYQEVHYYLSNDELSFYNYKKLRKPNYFSSLKRQLIQNPSRWINGEKVSFEPAELVTTQDGVKYYRTNTPGIESIYVFIPETHPLFNVWSFRFVFRMRKGDDDIYESVKAMEINEIENILQ